MRERSIRVHGRNWAAVARGLRAALPAAWLGALALLPGAAAAAQAAPIIRIDDPFVSTVWRVGIDNEGRRLVAGLASGSLATWDTDALESSRRLLHLPVREAEARRAHATAISPDGEVIALGVPPLRDDRGYAIPNSARIYIVAADSLRIVQQLEKVPSRAQDLKFSPDGRYLAAALSGGCGLRIWRREGWALHAFDDSGYAGPGASADVCQHAMGPARDVLPDTLGLAFAPSAEDPVWVVTSGETGVRTYRQGAGRLSPARFASAKDLGVEIPDGLAISPSGRQLAIGDRRHRQPDGPPVQGIVVVNLESLTPGPFRLSITGADLRFPNRIDPREFADARQFNLSRVTWDRMGGEEWVVAAGAFPCSAGVEHAVVTERPLELALQELCAVGWPVQDEAAGRPRFFPAGSEQANDIAIAARKASVVIATERDLVLFQLAVGHAGEPPNGSGRWLRTALGSRAADFRDRGQKETERLEFSVSDDANVVQIQPYVPLSDRAQPLRFDVRTLRVSTSPVAGDVLHPAAADAAAVEPLAGWIDSSSMPRINGVSRALGQLPWDVYRSVVALPQRAVVLGSANFLRVVSSADGRPRQLCALRIASEAFRLNASSDGTRLVVAHGDGTLRWYAVVHAADGSSCALRNILSVHFRRPATELDWAWIAWKPSSGEFATDPRVSALLSWQLTDPACQTTMVDFAALTRDLYDRAAVQTSLDAVQSQRPPSDRLARFCNAFSAQVLAPRVHTKVQTRQLSFKLAVKGLSGTSGRYAAMHVTMGGATRLAKTWQGKALAPDEPAMLSGDGEFQLNVTLPDGMPARGADFHVCFHVQQQQRDCHLLVWDGEANMPRLRKLWGVFVGISDYGLYGTNDVRSLRFASNDALDLASVFLRDHENQTGAASAERADRPDYASVSLDLFVAPLKAAGAVKELAEFTTRRGVSTGVVSSSGIYQALDRVAERIRVEGSEDDLFVMHFSGHGLAAHTDQVKGSSVLLLSGRPSGKAGQDGAQSYLDSQELLTRLSRINSRKLVIFDSCRNVSFDARSPPFDASKMRHEFESSVPSASVLFSTSEGFGSIETERYYFNKERDEGSRGNGLFSYVLLNGITSQRTREASKDFDPPNAVTVLDLWNYIRKIFNRQGRSDPTFGQKPVYIGAHLGDPVIIRSVELIPDQLDQ